MKNPQILIPMFVLAAWTWMVLALVMFTRVRAGMRRQVKINDFKFGESAAVPPQIGMPNKNYMNLLEIPVLFYVVCLLFFVTGGVSLAVVCLSWLYVALRIIHSVIHLSYNRVMHRLYAFAASNLVLLALWVVAASQVFALA